MIVVVLVSAVVYMVSFVLLQTLSRYREFAADRGSAIITGRPSALSSALLKISGTMDQIPQRDLRVANGELAAFYILPPRAKQSIATLFSTHPPLEARLEALSRLEAQLQGAGLDVDGSARRTDRQAQARAARARPAVRDHHRLRDPGDGTRR